MYKHVWTQVLGNSNLSIETNVNLLPSLSPYNFSANIDSFHVQMLFSILYGLKLQSGFLCSSKDAIFRC